MIDKISAFFYMMYLKADLAFKELESEEDGMETVQAIILVAVAVVVAGCIINVLTTGENGQPGLISKLFSSIQQKFDEMLGVK